NETFFHDIDPVVIWPAAPSAGFVFDGVGYRSGLAEGVVHVAADDARVEGIEVVATGGLVGGDPVVQVTGTGVELDGLEVSSTQAGVTPYHITLTGADAVVTGVTVVNPDDSGHPGIMALGS